MSDETGFTSADSSDDDGPESRPELPPPNFDFLVYSLRLQAELNMGLLPLGPLGENESEDDQPEPDFDLARHNIDMLAMLQEKTKGNLTSEEQRALDNSITELRFRFVEATRQGSKSP